MNRKLNALLFSSLGLAPAAQANIIDLDNPFTNPILERETISTPCFDQIKRYTCNLPEPQVHYFSQLQQEQPQQDEESPEFDQIIYDIF